MAKPAPIYRSDGGTFQADACLPLVTATAKGQVQMQALVHGHYPGTRLPPAALPGLKTVGYWDAAADQDWGLPWHRNEGVEVTFLESGSLPFAVDHHSYELKAGDLTITRPWQRHRVGNPNVGPGRLHWLIVDVGVRRPNQDWRWPPWLLLSPPDACELTDVLRHTEQSVWRATPEIRRCFESVARNISSISAAAIRINELYLLLLNLLRDKKPHLDRTLSTASRTVHLFLCDVKQNPELEWTVEQMAASCGLGVTQFIRHVKLLTNITPMHYLTRCRLEHAAHLLKQHPEDHITDIALCCGFASSQYFATVFRQHYGQTPREWRQKLIENRAEHAGNG